MLFEPPFDVVDFAYLIEYPGGDFGVIFAGFPKLTPNVGKAGNWDDVEIGVAFNEGAVGAKAVTLEAAGEGRFSFFVDKDVVEASVGATFMPVEEDAVVVMMVDPKLTYLNFAAAGFEAVDGGFVNFEVVAAAEFCSDEVV